MRIFIGVIIVCVLVMPVSAQMILGPRVTGYAGHATYAGTGYFTTTTFYGQPTIQLGAKLYSHVPETTFLFTNGIMEFFVDQTTGGGPMPCPGMTPYNWSAQLVGLTVTTASYPHDWLYCRLYDMKDSAEDAVINYEDIDAATGGYINQLFDHIPPVGTVFDPIDVTDALRRDLFGEGVGDATTGFTLDTMLDWGDYRKLRFAGNAPRIIVNLFGPTPTPTPSLTSTPFPTATPTPTPARPRVRIDMPATYFWPGMSAACSVFVWNPGPETLKNALLFVVLDAYGEYFFAPEFNDFSYYTEDFRDGETEQVVLAPFQWPSGAGSAQGIMWYAALTDPAVSGIVGEMDKFSFGWGE